MKISLSPIIAIATGLVFLAAYFIPFGPLQSLQTTLVGWTIILAAVAMLIGIIRLVTVNVQKVAEQKKGYAYSILAIAGFGITLILGFLFGPSSTLFSQLVTRVQLPIEASLMAILVVTLILGLIRMTKKKITGVNIVFILSVLAFLWAATGFTPFNTLPITRDVLSVFNIIPVGGGRGILLGVALGSLATGLRILLGSDRPYQS
jgi:hypothetical protein